MPKAEIAPFDDLKTQLLQLAAQFRHLVLVCNIAYQPDLKTFGVHRLQLNYFMKNLGHSQPNITVFDPNELINAVNPENDLLDNNHFNQGFETRIQGCYLSLLKNLP